MIRPLTSGVTNAALSAADLVFPPLNEPQKMLASPAIGFVYLKSGRIVACVCSYTKSKEYSRVVDGEISYFLAHLADRAKLTAKLHPWFSDISRPILKACYRIMDATRSSSVLDSESLDMVSPAIRPFLENAAHR